METFKTYKNNQKINVNISYNSIAKRFGPVSFFLAKENDANDSEIVNRETDESCKIEKNKATDRAILYMVSQFFVDSGQLANKENIMKATSLRYSVYDQDFRHTFLSTFTSFEDEYRNDSGAKFTVIKSIKIVLNENVLEAHKAFVATLNL